MANQVIRYALDTSRRSQPITAPAGATVVAAFTHNGQAFLELIGDPTATYGLAFNVTLASRGSDATGITQADFVGHITLGLQTVSVYATDYV